MIALVLITWWLVGFLSAAVLWWFSFKQITVGDCIMFSIFGIFGPVTTATCACIGFVDFLGRSKILQRTIIERKP